MFLLIKPSTHDFINSAHMRTPLHLTPHENFWMTTSHSSHFIPVQVIPHVLLTLFPVLVNITCMTKPKLLTVIHKEISVRNVFRRPYKQKCKRLKIFKKIISIEGLVIWTYDLVKWVNYRLTSFLYGFFQIFQHFISYENAGSGDLTNVLENWQNLHGNHQLNKLYICF